MRDFYSLSSRGCISQWQKDAPSPRRRGAHLETRLVGESGRVLSPEERLLLQGGESLVALSVRSVFDVKDVVSKSSRPGTGKVQGRRTEGGSVRQKAEPLGSFLCERRKNRETGRLRIKHDEKRQT